LRRGDATPFLGLCKNSQRKGQGMLERKPRNARKAGESFPEKEELGVILNELGGVEGVVQ